MLADRSSVRGYFLALAVLVIGAIGFRVLVAQANIYLMKERVDLRRPLDSVPTKLGRWQRVGSDSVFSETLIEELGTRSYLDRAYAIEGDPATNATSRCCGGSRAPPQAPVGRNADSVARRVRDAAPPGSSMRAPMPPGIRHAGRSR